MTNTFKIILTLCTLLVTKSAFSENIDLNKEVQISKVRVQIRELYAADQAVRSEVGRLEREGYTLQYLMDHTEITKYWKQVDHRNLNSLKKIIAQWGWPSISQYGKATDHQAWMLVQHADDDVEYQEKILKLLHEKVEEKETNPQNYAYLLDRVKMHRNQPQVYGTQGHCMKKSTWVPFPIADPKNLDSRRKSIGLTLSDLNKKRLDKLCY